MSPREFAVTWDYRCPFARNFAEHVLLGHTEAGDGWHVQWLGFSLNQTRVAEGEPDVWDDPEMAAARLAVEVGIAVRDRWPAAFADTHHALFAARHDHGLDIRDTEVVAGVLRKQGLDPGEVLDEVASGRPRGTFRAEHQAAVGEHRVFGVPTVIAGGQAVFVRLVDRPQTAPAARATVERCLDLVTGWPNLNEFKHTTIPR